MGLSGNPILDHIDDKMAELHPLARRALFQGLPTLMQSGGTAPAEAAPVAPMAGPATPPRSLGPALPRGQSPMSGDFGLNDIRRAASQASGNTTVTGINGPMSIPESAGATPSPNTLAVPARPARPIAPLQTSENLGHIDEFNRLTQPPLDRNDPLAHTRADTGLPGSQQIHNPIGRGFATVGDAILSGLFPRVAAAVPGTTAHHNALVGEAGSAVKQGQAVESEEQKRATEAAQIPGLEAEGPLREAQTREADARAASLLHPEAKTEFEAWQRDPRNAGKSVMDWFKEKAAAQPSHQEGELPLGDRIPQYNQALAARYKVLHPGADLPTHYTLSPTATQKDFDRVDKLLEQEEHATGTKAQQDESRKLREQTTAIAQGNRADAERDREAARFGKPHQAALTAANAQLEKIQEARAMINGSAEAQALGIPKVLTALVSGQGSGVRITQSEQDAIAKARGIGGDIEGTLRKWAGKGKLTPEQQQQIGQVLDDVQAIIQKKQGIVNDTLDRINSAPNRAEIVKADTDARKQLQELEKSPAGAGGAPIVQHSKSTGAYRYSTDGGKTWQPGQPPNQNK